MKAIIDGTVTEISPERWAAFEAFEKGEAKDWPQDGDKYWAIDGYGDVKDDDWSSNSCYCRLESEIGNIYRTQSEALAQVEKLKAKARIDKYIRDNGLECVPEFDAQDRWYVYFNIDKQAFAPSLRDCHRYFSLVELKTREHAQQVIDSCTDDLKTLFGI